MSLEENKWRDRAFESKIKIIYDINRPNEITHKYDNKVNNIAELNLLHDIINPFKRIKNINIH